MNACGCCVPDTATDDLVPDCGDAPAPMNASIPNVLLIGDSISMGTAATEGKPPYNPLGYGWGVRDALAVADIAQVQHNGGWFIAGQAGPSSKGVRCIGHWLGSGMLWILIIHRQGRSLPSSKSRPLPPATQRPLQYIYCFGITLT